jgi:aminoglycoside phosphotransferase (APT) family kinase protein
MTDEPLAALPPDYRDIARPAIAAVVGASAVFSVRPVLGGVSGALVFLVEAGRSRFVLRMEGPAGPLRNPHQYVAMRIAAEAGIAPPIRYLDTEDRVVMMDYVEDRPLETYPGGRLGLARAVGARLRKLQALPAFPGFMDYPDQVERVWMHVCGTGLFAEGLLGDASRRLVEVRKACTLDPENYVSSHNDVLPRNVLFDGRRLWLIDWENAYRNDPLVDLATALDNFAPSAELEEALLQAWLGRAPDRALRDRLALMRSLTRLFYAGVLFSASASARRTRPDTDLSALTHAEFEQAIRARRLMPETAPTSHALGKMYLASFLSGAAPPGLPPMYMR